MDFYLYNTLTRNKDKIIPVNEGRVGMYTCGPTVYNFAHIGNLRTYIYEDVLKKSMEYMGYTVKHVMNITDVGHLESDSDSGEDKMTLGSQRENKSVWDIARYYEDAFFSDCEKLNIKRPDVVCRATEHIEDMIKLIKTLEEKGYTYVSNGNVYFEIDKFKDYNRLANLSMDELEAGSRIEIDPNKKNPMDFALWFTNSKFKNHIMQWDSPWGTGFPGWHIECSAMSLKYLGEYIDIHCGGIDHVPVHHTNEIAQSEAALGHKWVNNWMHCEFLVVDSGKMSKSGGEFLTVAKLIKDGFSPMDYRYFCLQSRYRKKLLFSYDNLKDAQTALRKLKAKIGEISKTASYDMSPDGQKLQRHKNEFLKHIGDDLNIPNAITVVHDVVKSNELSDIEKLELIKDFDRVLSLDLLKREYEGEKIQETPGSSISEEYIMERIRERDAARAGKNWAKADEIRNGLLERNIELVDTKEGTIWRIRQ